MTLRTLLAVTVFAAVASATAFARDLTIVNRSAALKAAQNDAYFRPFADALGEKLDLQVWSGGLDQVRQHMADWDLVEASADEAALGCDNAFTKLNWQAIGGRDRYLPPAVTDCGVGAGLSSTVLAWDRDKFPGTPSWSDFWDVARYPGKRGLRRSPRTNLEIALLADGVAPGDVYRVLRTDDGVDRAFRKLDQIKPYVSWWETASQAAQMLSSGEVLLTSASNVAITEANRDAKRHFGLQWNGSLFTVLFWCIVKGSAFEGDALKLLDFAGDPSRQAIFATDTAYGPTSKGATDQLAPDVLPVSPSAPSNLANSLQIDEGFWRDQGDKLDQRFEAWLSH